jgi:carbon storage regulator
MLVLARKTNEAILIGDEIRIRIGLVSGGTVRLCIEAPRDVPVYREELLDRTTAGPSAGDRSPRRTRRGRARAVKGPIAIRSPLPCIWRHRTGWAGAARRPGD